MIKSTSAGVILFRYTRNKIEYLVIKGRTGDWEFPKGGIENDEEYQQTALRELEEETGVTEVKLYPDFKDEYSYIFYSDNQKISKTVHLFVGQSFQTHVDLSKEHTDYQWRTYEQAMNTITHDSITNILEQAHNFIKGKVAVKQ